MAQKTPQSITDAIKKLFFSRYSTKVFIQRSYDNWTFKQLWGDGIHDHLARNQKLNYAYHADYGSDIAVAKFVINYCSGQVKNENDRWLTKSSDLPKFYTKTFKVTGIGASNAGLISEGIDNFVGLDHCQSIDLSKNPKLDNFACDQLSRQFRKSKTLTEIDLSHNPRISVHGLEILFRIPSLKKIIAINTAAAKYPDIDLFILGAQEEKNCDVFVNEDGRLNSESLLEST